MSTPLGSSLLGNFVLFLLLARLNYDMKNCQVVKNELETFSASKLRQRQQLVSLGEMRCDVKCKARSTP